MIGFADAKAGGIIASSPGGINENRP